MPCWQVLAESHPFEPVLRGFLDLILAPSPYQVVTVPSASVRVIVTLQAPPSNWAFLPCRKLADPIVEKRSRASRASILWVAGWSPTHTVAVPTFSYVCRNSTRSVLVAWRSENLSRIRRVAAVASNGAPGVVFITKPGLPLTSSSYRHSDLDASSTRRNDFSPFSTLASSVVTEQLSSSALALYTRGGSVHGPFPNPFALARRAASMAFHDMAICSARRWCSAGGGCGSNHPVF